MNLRAGHGGRPMKPDPLLYRPHMAVHITNAGFAAFIKRNVSVCPR